jgi:hypothetical protein
VCYVDELAGEVPLTLDTVRSTKTTIRLCPVSTQNTQYRVTAEAVISVFRVSNESITVDDFMRGDPEAQKDVSPMNCNSF